MMKSFGVRLGVFACAAALAGTLALPERASACGGCFAPQGSPTVVTRHQMAVALTTTETTLWDQIEYAGNPEDFVWVLPVRGGVPVELADNAFFEALEQATTITMQAPNPPVTFCSDPCSDAFASAEFDRSGAADAGSSGVIVHHQATIGPYETVTIGSEDPDALVAWLRARDYGVPDAILPTIRHYTDQGMDFAVLRLSPNAGVNQMQPVRVTMPGMNPTFPLRMVAAGVEGKVGLELFVFAEGRYEASNFTNALVDRERLTFDWTTSAFNYDALYAEAIATDGGRVWVTEYAQTAPYDIQYYQSWDESGQMHSAMDDYAVVLRGLSSPYLTRMTSDMPSEHLGEDLVLAASAGGDLGNFIQVTRELNRAPDVVCSDVCTDPYGTGGGGLGWRSGGRGDGLCSVSAAGTGSMIGLFAIALAGVALILRRRR